MPEFVDRIRERHARRKCERDGHVWVKTPRIPPLSTIRYEDRCRRCGVWREPRTVYFEITLDDE